MPGRSPHRHSPVPSTSHRSPGLRGRLRSPERHRIISTSSRPGRSTDFRTSGDRRSRSPVRKSRSLSPTVKRNLSPKRDHENQRRLLPPHSSKLSRSKSPDSSSRSPEYKTEFRKSSSAVGSCIGSYEKEGVQFRGPEKFDVKELKKIAVDIRRHGLHSDNSRTVINRAIINPDDITIVRRADEGVRPIFSRPELAATNISRDRTPDDEYRRIATVDPDREPSRGCCHESVREHSSRYEERSRPYYSNEARERVRSPGYSSRRSPNRTEAYNSRDRAHDERRGSNRELDGRRHDDVRYSERRHSYDRDRERVNEQRSESHHHHEDRHHGRERRRSDHVSPTHRERERRRGSIEVRRPPRESSWDREGEGRRNRTRSKSRSRSREEGRMRGSDRERHEEFSIVTERPRRYPVYRNYYPTSGEFIPIPIRGRGAPLPIRRGLPGPPMFHGRPMMRGAPMVFRGVPFMRGVPPRAPFMGIRGGFVPRFYPPF